MKCNQLRESPNQQPASWVENDAASGSLGETDMQVYESSAEVYQRRWKQKAQFDRRDCWIAVAVYLLVASFALVVL
jgi:hypothetical protein